MATVSKNPTSDLAVTGTWTGTVGSRYTYVDDHPDASGADSIQCSVAGVIAFGFPAFAIPANSTAISVQVLYYDSKAGSQSSSCGALLRCNDTTNRLATGHNPANATWTSRTDNYANNPKTSAAWTVNDVNGVGTNGLTAFGLSVTDASPAVSLSSITVQVSYTPPVTGTLAVSESADSGSAAGTVKWLGTLAATDTKDTASASGTISAGGFTGTLAVTESVDIAALSGTISTGVSGTLTATEAKDSLAASGKVRIDGTFAVTESKDTVSSAGTVRFLATLSATESPDSASISALSKWLVAMAAQESPDVAEFLQTVAVNDNPQHGRHFPAGRHSRFRFI